MEPSAQTHFQSLPAFPLSGTVLFPGTVLPLHIFEPRYRDLVADVLAGDRMMAVVMALGSTEPDASPEVAQVAGCGRIIHAERLADGRYNILVQGQHRVRLTDELPRERSYRRFNAQVIPRPDERMIGEAKSELAKLQSCVLSLRALVAESDETLVEVLRATADPIDLSDILAAALVSTPQMQQQILESERLRDRLSLLIDALAEVMLRFGEPGRAQILN